ncbi:hypothetical protein KKF59_04130 [Patescibacteria group bacterium]|nr:hypothetical protein [Patescibacteria group bacterium]MBU1630077.1 hypothetical protein [Patescibacteria group bacterium]MBU1908281.1 hypothetical protein [Patescibacteria group bacterium]
MTDKTKKILFAIFFVIFSLAIGFGLYYLFYKPLVAPAPVAVPEAGLPGALPSAPLAGERIPAEEMPPGALLPSALAPTVPTAPAVPAKPTVYLLNDTVSRELVPASDGQGARFYSPEDGRFYRVNPDGSITALSDKQFLNVDNISWAKKSDEAILEFPDGSNVLYDFTTSRQTTLPKHWQDFAFSPDDSSIVAKSIGLDPDNRFLIVSDPNGNEAKAIEPLGQNAALAISNWSPNNQVIAFAKTGKPQSEGAEEIYLIGENRENFKSLIVPGRGFEPNWSPTGQQILYSVYHERDDLKPSLWVSGGVGDHIGEDRRGLNLKTWADKCVWQNESELYCGVPQSLDAGAGLAPDQFSDGPDDLYHVDLRTGVSIKISTPEQSHPIKNPVLSADQSQLMFVDARTGRVYSYVLP